MFYSIFSPSHITFLFLYQTLQDEYHCLKPHFTDEEAEALEFKRFAQGSRVKDKSKPGVRPKSANIPYTYSVPCIFLGDDFLRCPNTIQSPYHL